MCEERRFSCFGQPENLSKLEAGESHGASDVVSWCGEPSLILKVHRFDLSMEVFPGAPHTTTAQLSDAEVKSLFPLNLSCVPFCSM